MVTIMKNQHRIIANRQTGVVLVISLIMLLALTLIGVTSSNVTGLEERMAANSKDKNLAFQAAESALRYVETNLGATNINFDCTTKPLTGVNGLYYSIVTPDPLYYTQYTSPTQYATPATGVANWFANATDATTCGNTTTTTSQASIYSLNDHPAATGTAPSLGNLCRNPRYIIEKIYQMANNGSGNSSFEGGTATYGGTPTTGETDTFRITVQGWGSNANSTAQVQSIVRVNYSTGTSINTNCP
jgi:Tfp pilus assembly protein PilX